MKAARYLLTVSVALVLVITTASAYLRLDQYGLGCTDWPACYGKNVVAETALSQASSLFWVRLVHRVAATVAGLLFVAIPAFFWNRRQSGSERLVSLVPVALAGFLAWLGRYTPSSLHAVTLGNLLGGMAVLAALGWLRESARARDGPAAGKDSFLARAAALGLAMVFVQIALGGLTSARLAALACTAFPQCGAWAGSLESSAFNPFAYIAPEVLGEGARQTLHMTHRLLGFALAAYLAWLGARAMRTAPSSRLAGTSLLVLVLVQLTLGAAMVLADLPLALAVAHNAVAGLLIVALASLIANQA